MKKFILILIAVVIMGYLIFSASYFSDSSHENLCERFEVIISDSSITRFVDTQEIVNLVKREDLYPVGKKFGEINTLAIRDAILTNRLVESVKVFTTADGSIVGSIRQREPVLRIISDTKGSFYVDKDRMIMPLSSNFAVYLPVATGIIDEEFAQNELYDFAMFLRGNPDWDAWIAQIVVKKDKEVLLIPRAGDFKIILGSLDNYPDKLAKFALFVEKGLNVVGWNRYSEINLKYENQVVATRK